MWHQPDLVLSNLSGHTNDTPISWCRRLRQEFERSWMSRTLSRMDLGCARSGLKRHHSTFEVKIKPTYKTTLTTDPCQKFCKVVLNWISSLPTNMSEEKIVEKIVIIFLALKACVVVLLKWRWAPFYPHSSKLTSTFLTTYTEFIYLFWALSVGL